MQELCREYMKRTRWNICVKEFPLINSGDVELNKQQEAKLLWPNASKNSYIIAMDSKGVQYSSLEFAACIAKLQSLGTHNFYFLIGGSDGHANSTVQSADLLLSFGKLTLPHQLARLILLEQLYRVYCINSNHPYHK